MRTHPHLKEVRAWLDTKKIKYDRINLNVCFWLDSTETCRVIVRHINSEDEINILLPKHPGLTYKLSCRRFGDERLEHFEQALDRLKLFLLK